jgi:hypothetical protein
LDAELVAFGIPHYNPVLTTLSKHLKLLCAVILQYVDMAIDRIHPIDVVDTGSSPGVDIEVDPVLGGLPFGDALEQHPGTGPIGIDDRGEVVAILRWDIVGVGELIPTGETGWRRL